MLRLRTLGWLFLLFLLFLGAITSVACGGGSAGVCGSGSWQPGTLEIHHFSVGQADSTLLVGPTGRSLLVDVGESAARVDTPGADPSGAGQHAGADQVGEKVERVLGCRRIDAILATHFHLDHVGAVGQGGVWHLIAVQGFTVGTIWHRDLEAYSGVEGVVFSGWRQSLARAPAGWQPGVIHPGRGQLDLGPGIDLDVVAVDGDAVIVPGALGAARPIPPNENDYSVAFTLRFGSLDYLLGGDLSGQFWPGADSTYHDVETAAARGLRDVDVYRVNHHGSDHSSNPTWLGQIDPEIAIVSAGAGNPYGHPAAATLRRLAATGAVYATSRGATARGAGARDSSAGSPVVPAGGDVILRSSDGLHYTVAGDPYLATDPLRVDDDGDGYFREIDPDDRDATTVPRPFGGCDPAVQICAP